MSQIHGSTPSKIIIEPDVCARKSTQGHPSGSIYTLDQIPVKLSEKDVPCGMEAVVACFDEHWCIWGIEEWVMKE